jgi:hypothetical protein
MRTKVKEFFLHLIVLFSLLIPYSISVISTDFSFKQDVSSVNSEFKATVYKSYDSLFSESNDDVEETSLTDLFSFSLFNRQEYFSLALRQNFIPFQKIPFKLLSIPPPSI